MKDERTVKIRGSEDIEYNGKEGERELWEWRNLGEWKEVLEKESEGGDEESKWEDNA